MFGSAGQYVWEGSCGAALVGLVGGAVTLDLGLFLFSLAILLLCLRHWSR